MPQKQLGENGKDELLPLKQLSPDSFTRKAALRVQESPRSTELGGFPVSESLVFGLDATLGFAFIDNVTLGTQGRAQDFLGGMPFFIGGKQGTITRNSLPCRVLGATCEEQVFTSAEKAWRSARDYLTAGHPLVACVDMFYLPYHATFHQIHFRGTPWRSPGTTQVKRLSWWQTSNLRICRKSLLQPPTRPGVSAWGEVNGVPQHAIYHSSSPGQQAPSARGGCETCHPTSR